MRPFAIRRRTEGERVAYLQGHLAALRMAVNHEDVGDKAKRVFNALIELETKQLHLGDAKAVSR